MLSKILKIFKKDYQTLNLIEVSKANLIHNYKYLSSLNEQSSRASRTKKIKVAPVIKSNGYGHGIVEIAKILDQVNAPFFCVDSLYEAYELLKARIKTKILIMGYTNPENFKVKKLPFSFALYDLKTAKVLSKYQPECSVHIFVDTGMSREGIQMKDLPLFLEELKGLKYLKVEGLISHFACADDPKNGLNLKQINNLKHVQQIVRKAGFNPKYIHIQNSDGLLRFHLRGCNVNIARVGLALYGISNSHIRSGNVDLKPVLKLKTKIIQIKELKKGDKVGYESLYTAKRNLTVGILPLGYYEGVDLRLSNKGIVFVDGIECPIIGRVSMNITTIDITKVSKPYIGQEVIVYSDNPRGKNSILNCAKICQTIPYELLVNLAESTKRIVI
ncbi:alanine racemase [Candidatus Daviesbacteria bacterium]|nr:alanine racemase [Candidatus Daviesbacteria bacterium]